MSYSEKAKKIVRSTRRLLNLTQAEFAELFPRASLDIVKNWEMGRTVPRSDVLLQIQDILRDKRKSISAPITPNKNNIKQKKRLVKLCPARKR